MTRTKEIWAEVNYPPTEEQQLNYNKMLVDYDLFDEVVSAVTDATRTPAEELFQKTKDNHITQSRYLIYYILKENGYKLATISRCMKVNGYNAANSTILYGIKQIHDKLSTDSSLAEFVSRWK